jgi:hypothetical protein
MTVTAVQVHNIIANAGFVLNPYAKTYVRALSLAESEYGEEGVKTQILYILNNVTARGEIQKAAKKLLQDMANK